jgi:hypothetical protein
VLQKRISAEQLARAVSGARKQPKMLSRQKSRPNSGMRRRVSVRTR